MKLDRLVFVVAALGAIASCGEDSEAPGFHVTLEFASASGGPRRCTDPCEAYVFSCDAMAAIRVTNAEDPLDIYDTRCVPLPATGDLCGLSELDINFLPMPAGPAHIGVTIWNANDLEDGDCIQGELFDLQGEPLITLDPQPAVGGAIFHPVGSEADALIPMACIAPEQVARDDCSSP